MLPLCLSSAAIRGGGSCFYGGAVTSFLYDANIHHIQLQHLLRHTGVLGFQQCVMKDELLFVFTAAMMSRPESKVRHQRGLI